MIRNPIENSPLFAITFSISLIKIVMIIASKINLNTLHHIDLWYSDMIAIFVLPQREHLIGLQGGKPFLGLWSIIFITTPRKRKLSNTIIPQFADKVKKIKLCKG